MPDDHPRVLIVDDNEAIHRDFDQILDRRADVAREAALDDLERLLGGAARPPAAHAGPRYDLHHVYQGEDAVRAVADAGIAGRPFALAFVDVRMPPGIDGIETIARMWQHQPELEVVLCSAHNDYTWDSLTRILTPRDRLVVLRKPFDGIEVQQLAACLSEKWQRGLALDAQLRDLEAAVQAEVDARIRERTRHEEEQRRSERLEALGRVAAGLAHEINTPTQFASNNLDYIAAAVARISAAVTDRLAAVADDIAELPRAISDTRAGLESIARIVHGVRSYTHLRNREGFAPVDVNQQVRSALELARSQYRYDADLQLDLTEVPPVLGDAGELTQAILNLVVNAAHAIREVRGRDEQRPRGVIAIASRTRGDLVEVSIGDDGGGIPADVQDRIFDPFFTTKKVGQGTGQGLSIVRTTIVDRHHGSIRFDTEPGRGTTFVIGLPRAEGGP